MAVYTYKYSAQTNTGWTNGANAVDDTDGTYATVEVAKNKSDGDGDIITATTVSATASGGIASVEIGVEAKSSGSGGRIIRTPVFGGSSNGNEHSNDITTSDVIYWIDITTDTNAPSSWTWTDVGNLDAKVEAANSSTSSARTISIDQIYVRVTTYDGPEPPITKTLNYARVTTGPNSSMSSDAFDDNSFNTTIWDPYVFGSVSYAEQNNRFEVSQSGGPTADDSSGYKMYYDSVVTGDFSCSIKFTSCSTTAGTDTNSEHYAFIGLEADANNDLYGYGPDRWDNATGYDTYYFGMDTSFSGGTNISFPYWVKMERIDGTLSFYKSTNGTTWTLVNSATCTFDDGWVLLQSSVNMYDADSVTASVYFNDFVNISFTTETITSISLYDNTTDMTNTLPVYVNGAKAYAHLRTVGAGTYETDLRVRKGGVTYSVSSQYDAE